MLFILILNEICCNDRFCMREKHSSWLKLTEQKKNTQESRCTNCCNGINLKFWHKICLRNLKRMSTVARETERGDRDTLICYVLFWQAHGIFLFALLFVFPAYLFESVRVCDDSFSEHLYLLAHPLLSHTHACTHIML